MTDLNNFLGVMTSFITSKQLKNYKSLEAHNYVTSGWVKEPWVKQAGQNTVIVTEVSALTCVIHSFFFMPPVKHCIVIFSVQVNHSQSLTSP